MRVHPLRWKATRRFSSSRAAFARRLTGHERRTPEETCELVVGPTRSSSIFVRALSMSCTFLSHRSCSVVDSDCSKALTCGLWDTNALNLQRRRRPRMLFCGTKGPLLHSSTKERVHMRHIMTVVLVASLTGCAPLAFTPTETPLSDDSIPVFGMAGSVTISNAQAS